MTAFGQNICKSSGQLCDQCPVAHLCPSKKAKKKTRVVKKVAPKPVRPQDYIDKLNVLTLKPGLVFRYFRGPLCINVAEVDIRRNNLAVRPYLAGYSFDRLKTVEDHASESKALVAVNANYFKKDGTPLGAIKMDGVLANFFEDSSTFIG